MTSSFPQILQLIFTPRLWNNLSQISSQLTCQMLFINVSTEKEKTGVSTFTWDPIWYRVQAPAAYRFLTNEILDQIKPHNSPRHQLTKVKPDEMQSSPAQVSPPRRTSCQTGDRCMWVDTKYWSIYTHQLAYRLKFSQQLHGFHKEIFMLVSEPVGLFRDRLHRLWHLSQDLLLHRYRNKYQIRVHTSDSGVVRVS